MKVKIRRFRASDRARIIECMEALQDYLVAVDQMKFTRRMPEYGEVFTKRLLSNVAKNNGVIYVSEHEDRIIGFIAGIVYSRPSKELLEAVPLKSGRILELFVDPYYRGKQIGTMLAEKMEEYFRQKHCDVSRVEVFEPNTMAHHFYKKLGYCDRIIDMMKKMEKP